MKVLMRTPNTSEPFETEIDPKKFTLMGPMCTDEVFGLYGDDYVAIDKESYLKF